jgi:hypothetical protein
MTKEIRLRAIDNEYGDWSAHFISWADWSEQYKNITIVKDDSYTHALLYNFAQLTKPLPKENVLGFFTEPYPLRNPEGQFEYAKDHISKLFVHEKLAGYPDFCEEYIPFLGCARGINQQLTPQVKTKFCSIIASHKGFLSGHSLRHQLIRAILQTDLPIDIYGRHIETMYRGDPRIKGTIDNKDPAFVDYEYTIAIENHPHPAWITEKYYDPLMTGCVPIYWGSTDIDRYYSNKCHIRLAQGVNIDVWIEQLRNLYANNPKMTAHEGQRIIKEYQNLPEFIWRIWNHE